MPSVSGQFMYPGDVNDNGIVNGVDVLYWGVAFGSEGPERLDATTDFMPQSITPWGAFFPNGVNYAFADVDGDGDVDEEDLDDDDDGGLVQNYGLIHGVVQPDAQSPAGIPGVDPLFSTTPDVPIAIGGQPVEVTVSLGDAATPVFNFYGLAFTIEYDPTVIDPASVQFLLPPNPWYDPAGLSSAAVVVDQAVPGRVEVALTRTNQLGANGFGDLGVFSFILIEDVVGAKIVDSTFEVGPVLLGNPSLTPLPLAVEGTEPVSATSEIWSAGALQVFPNPAQREVWVETSGFAPEEMTLVDAYGRRVRLWGRPMGQDRYLLDLGAFPEGLYWLTIYTEQGFWSEPLLIQRE